MNVGKYAKAIVSGLAAGAAVALTALADGVLSTGEIYGIVAAVISGLGVTYAVPNDKEA